MILDVTDVIKQLAERKAEAGECPPEELIHERCLQYSDCKKCWIDTVREFLEVDRC